MRSWCGQPVQSSERPDGTGQNGRLVTAHQNFQALSRSLRTIGSLAKVEVEGSNPFARSSA